MLATGTLLAQGGGKGGGGGGSGGNGNGNAGGGFGNSGRDASTMPAPRADKPDKPEKPERRNDDKPANASRSAAPAARELSSSMRDINQTAFSARRELMADVDMRLKSNREALKQIQNDAKASRIDARADFKAALDTVKTREKDLDAALKRTRKADEKNWDVSRGELSRAHQAHADALARLRALPKPPTP